MKKVVILSVCASLMLSSCGTYTGEGAYAGAQIGSVLGSAIGGISDGHHGYHVGTIIGTVGGAVIGGAIGNKADRDMQTRTEERHRRIQEREQNRQSGVESTDTYDDDMYQGGPRKAPNKQNNRVPEGQDDSGFDESNSGDDRIYDFDGSDYNGDYSAQKPVQKVPEAATNGQMKYAPEVEIRNARFVDDNQDGKLSRGEMGKIIFEVYNKGSWPIKDVVPTVIETTGNRHITVSPSVHVEKINPGKGVRYTAIVAADNRLKEGTAKFCASVIVDNREISKISEFNIPTGK